jgi:hypothetical protein
MYIEKEGNKKQIWHWGIVVKEAASFTKLQPIRLIEGCQAISYILEA